MRRAENIKNVGFTVKTAKKTNYICSLKVKLDSNHKNNYIFLFLGPKSIHKYKVYSFRLKTYDSGSVVIRCEIASKTQYFPSKLH